MPTPFSLDLIERDSRSTCKIAIRKLQRIRKRAFDQQLEARFLTA
jgi:hypothetical protein